MTGTAARRQLAQGSASSDEHLIRRCLENDAQAWSTLIDKYKNLIYSIAIKLGMHQDAGDIFQAVCVTLFSKLSELREHRALPKWLMQTCYHECLQHQRIGSRHTGLEPAHLDHLLSTESLPEQMLVQLEQEQALREAIAEMPSRCARMIHMLFFETPSRPYAEVANALGLAEGSIGFIRGRCLARLRKHLEAKVF
ncbi:MAG TPA: sigma-70 family RNA polymerase sigma factor [Terriglobales bacterium]|nr:sigma-70 family RNA polymerase sigma factor [Terriglobales bacterium]